MVRHKEKKNKRQTDSTSTSEKREKEEESKKIIKYLSYKIEEVLHASIYIYENLPPLCPASSLAINMKQMNVFRVKN